MFGVDKKQLAVFELVENRLFLFEVPCLPQTCVKLSCVRPQILPGKILENGQQIFEVNTEEVVPEIITGTEQMCEHIHSTFRGQKVDNMAGKLFCGDLVQELIKMAHRGRGIRSFRKKAGELFDHFNGHTQAFPLRRVLYLSSP